MISGKGGGAPPRYLRAAVIWPLILAIFLGVCVAPAGEGEAVEAWVGSKTSYIRWVDFTPTCAAMQQALYYDTKSYGKSIHLDWIELLAATAAQTGGRFSKKRCPELDRIAGRLQAGELMEDITADWSYYPYYLEAYTAALEGLVGEYKEKNPETGRTVQRRGIRGYCPIAGGWSFSHYNDFGTARNYGFSRTHLGNDLLGSIGAPIVAVEGGYVEALGWNRFGGWRIGIRSHDKKRYYYYAHMRRNHPYVKTLEEGDVVEAGDVIGYLGMTGYSIKENVNNIRVPHLHFGMQLIFDESQKEGSNEIWIDVYEIVEFLKQKRSKVVRDEGAEDYRKAAAPVGDEVTPTGGEVSPVGGEVSPVGETVIAAWQPTRPRDRGIPLPILMYHSVLPDPVHVTPYIISPKTLEKDINWLLEHGFTPVDMQEVIDYVYGEGQLPEKPVVLSFDDGYRNMAAYVLPLLQKYSIPAVLAVVGSFIDTSQSRGASGGINDSMDWDELARLAAAGYFEIANHSYDMHGIRPRHGTMRMNGESPVSYRQALIADVQRLQDALTEKLGQAPQVFVYPYGNISGDSVEILADMGFAATLTCYETPNYISHSPDSLICLGRYNRNRKYSTEAYMRRLLGGYAENLTEAPLNQEAAWAE